MALKDISLVSERSSSSMVNSVKGTVARTANHPVLSVLLLLVLLPLALKYYRSTLPPALPSLAGYSWSEHPNTLLLAYPDKDCGCGVGPYAMVADGLRLGMDVLVISPSPSTPLRALQASGYPPNRLKVLTDVNAQLVAQFTTNSKQGGFARIQNGRVTQQFYDGALLTKSK